jgi:Na+-transporting methylmalonyl-CoA/oxaloacetate decarboxylase beta subunit
MHAMGSSAGGPVGSAMAAGVMLSILKDMGIN